MKKKFEKQKDATSQEQFGKALKQRGVTGYAGPLSVLKERTRAAQVKAALSVNRELVLLYWQIGQEILKRQARENCRFMV